MEIKKISDTKMIIRRFKKPKVKVPEKPSVKVSVPIEIYHEVCKKIFLKQSQMEKENDKNITREQNNTIVPNNTTEENNNLDKTAVEVPNSLNIDNNSNENKEVDRHPSPFTPKPEHKVGNIKDDPDLTDYKGTKSKSKIMVIPGGGVIITVNDDGNVSYEQACEEYNELKEATNGGKEYPSSTQTDNVSMSANTADSTDVSNNTNSIPTRINDSQSNTPQPLPNTSSHTCNQMNRPTMESIGRTCQPGDWNSFYSSTPSGQNWQRQCQSYLDTEMDIARKIRAEERTIDYYQERMRRKMLEIDNFEKQSILDHEKRKMSRVLQDKEDEVEKLKQENKRLEKEKSRRAEDLEKLSELSRSQLSSYNAMARGYPLRIEPMNLAIEDNRLPSVLPTTYIPYDGPSTSSSIGERQNTWPTGSYQATPRQAASYQNFTPLVTPQAYLNLATPPAPPLPSYPPPSLAPTYISQGNPIPHVSTPYQGYPQHQQYQPLNQSRGYQPSQQSQLPKENPKTLRGRKNAQPLRAHQMPEQNRMSQQRILPQYVPAQYQPVSSSTPITMIPTTRLPVPSPSPRPILNYTNNSTRVNQYISLPESLLLNNKMGYFHTD